MTLQHKQAIFALNVGKLIIFIYKQGYAVTFGEALRTEEQANIYAQQGKGIVDSLHRKKLAVDLNLFDSSGKYCNDVASFKQFGEYWKTLDPANRFGGDFKRVDLNHFEMQDL